MITDHIQTCDRATAKACLDADCKTLIHFSRDTFILSLPATYFCQIDELPFISIPYMDLGPDMERNNGN